MKIDLLDTTFVIPMRIDSIERFENLDLILDYLIGVFDTKIIVLESDSTNAGLVESICSGRVEYIFVNDPSPVFHRTKYINILAGMVTTDYIAVWDSDVIVNPGQLVAAVEGLRGREYEFVFPYDGRFLDIGIPQRIKFFESRSIDYLTENSETMRMPYTDTACGGGFLARLSDYIECGGENENFYGWGQEDGERVSRWKTLEKRVRRVNGAMFHLYHPRGQNSNYLSADHRKSQISEFERIDALDKDALWDEINAWKRIVMHK